MERECKLYLNDRFHIWFVQSNNLLSYYANKFKGNKHDLCNNKLKIHFNISLTSITGKNANAIQYFVHARV